MIRSQDRFKSFFGFQAPAPRQGPAPPLPDSVFLNWVCAKCGQVHFMLGVCRVCATDPLTGKRRYTRKPTLLL